MFELIQLQAWLSPEIIISTPYKNGAGNYLSTITYFLK